MMSVDVTPISKGLGQGRISVILLMVQKSGDHQLIFGNIPLFTTVLFISGDAGFLPSTVGCLG